MTTRDITPSKSRRRQDPLGVRGDPFGEREIEVLAAIWAGAVTHKMLAVALSVAVRTANMHLCNIYAKTGAVNVADLVLMMAGRKPCGVELAPYRSKIGLCLTI